MYALFEFTYWAEDSQMEVKIHFSFQEWEWVAIAMKWQNN